METKEKKISFIVNLTKRQLFLLSTLAVFSISLIFFSGYFIGKAQMDRNDELARLENPQTENLSLEVKNNESEIVFEDNISSSLFLSKDLNNTLEARTEGLNQRNQPNPAKKTLRKNPAKTTPTKSIKKGKEKYYLQVIVTANRNKAEYIKNQFQSRKYPAYVVAKELKNRELYTIRLGNYRDKKVALRHLEFIRNNSPYKETFIKRLNK